MADDRLVSYFVSYAHGTGFGCSTLVASRPITTWDDIVAMTKSIEESDGLELGTVVIINYIEMGRDDRG